MSRKKDINDEDEFKSSIKYLSWMQEFSKKIVFIVFILFLLSNVFFLVIISIQFIIQGDMMSIDTYMSEIHSTFREVIGGYLIKSATENVFKIGGSYLKSYSAMKSEIMKQKMDNENNKEGE